jgi:hypothetical protein
MATFTVTKGYNTPNGFVSGEVITPAKLNSAQSPAVALDGETIVNADVSPSAEIALSKIATGALPAAITVTTANLVDASVTAAKLSGAQTGSAPIFGCRAWVNFDGVMTNVTGNSYSRTTTTVTVTKATHGLTTGNRLLISSATDTGLNTAANTASAEITFVDANTFTFQTASTGTATGTLTYARGIRGAGNVASVTRNSTGNYTVTFTTALPSANYSAVASSGGLDEATGAESTATTNRAAASFTVSTANAGVGVTNRAEVSVVVFG